MDREKMAATLNPSSKRKGRDKLSIEGSPSKAGLYKTMGSSPSAHDSTLRARLVGMKEAIIELRAGIQITRNQVKAYKDKLKSWKKEQIGISLKERNEQQLKATRSAFARRLELRRKRSGTSVSKR